MGEAVLGLPRVGSFAEWFGRTWIKLAGWGVEGELPNVPKMVIVFAPHTSNWDFFYILPAAYALGLKPNFIGKKELFWWPLGAIMRALGGIPVDRHGKRSMVDQMVQLIHQRDHIALGIAPEGTRSNVPYWKSGFYHMAHQAGVPILLAFTDYARKRAGFGPLLTTTGDADADMSLIRDFYSSVTAKFPHEVGEVALKPRDS